ncbi:hypothetical protein M408DRAFT_80910, partial [Serendipita vermifera MAFF 305830]
EVDGRAVEIELWDTSTHDDYDRARLRAYQNSAVVVLCFAIDASESLRTIREKWYPEILYFLSSVPLLLVGYRHIRLLPSISRDFRPDEFITPNQAQILVDEFGAIKYLECSPLQKTSITALQETVGRAAMSWDPTMAANRSNKKDCIII